LFPFQWKGPPNPLEQTFGFIIYCGLINHCHFFLESMALLKDFLHNPFVPLSTDRCARSAREHFWVYYLLRVY